MLVCVEQEQLVRWEIYAVADLVLWWFQIQLIVALVVMIAVPREVIIVRDQPVSVAAQLSVAELLLFVQRDLVFAGRIVIVEHPAAVAMLSSMKLAM